MDAVCKFSCVYDAGDLDLVPGLESRGPMLSVKHRLDSKAPVVEVWITTQAATSPDKWLMEVFTTAIIWVKDDDTVLVEGLPAVLIPSPPGGVKYAVTVIA